MTAKIKYLTAATAIALMTASSAFASEVETGGRVVNVGVVGENAVNVANGSESTAEQNIGTISISGDSVLSVGSDLVNVGVVGRNAVNVAFGFKSEATQNIGTISVESE
jgi:hypothetical protein